MADPKRARPSHDRLSPSDMSSLLAERGPIQRASLERFTAQL